MGRLIDSDKLEYTCNSDECGMLTGCNHCQYNIVTQNEIDSAPTVEAIPIPHDATNEDVLKAIFPNDAENIIHHIKTAILNGWLSSRYEGVENGNDD